MKNFSPDDDQLRHLLQNHEFEFLPQAWENMQQKLQQPHKKTRGLAWWWASVGFCSVIGISLATYALLFSNNTQSDVLPNKQIIVPVANPKTSPQVAKEQPTADYLNSNNNQNNSSIAENSTNNSSSKASKTAKIKQKAKFPKAVYQLETPKLLEIKLKEENKQIITPQPLAYNSDFCPAEVKAQVVDFLPTINQEPEPVVIAKKPNRRLRAQIWLGTTANQPNDNSVAFGLQLGAGVDYQLTKRQHISAGLQYKQVFTSTDFMGTTLPMAAAYLDSYELANVSPLYNKAQIYELQRIDLLELPVSYHYQLTSRHSLNATAKLGLVFHTATLNANEQQPIQMTAQDMNLSRTTAAVGLGYEWRFAKQWSLGVQANLGLNNLALNSQKSYRAYTSYAGEDAKQGELFLMLNDDSAKPSMLRIPERVYNSDLQIAAKYTF